MASLISPVEYSGDFRTLLTLRAASFLLDCLAQSTGPYFTIYDGDFEHYRQHARGQFVLSASTTEFF